MASRFNSGVASRRGPELVDDSYSDDCLIKEEDIISEEQDNSRIRQTISYLSTQSGSDAFDLYSNGVQIISNQILRLYAEEGHLFNPTLFRQLSAMVPEAQTDFGPVDDDDMNTIEVTEDVEEMEQKALLREYHGHIDESAHGVIARFQETCAPRTEKGLVEAEKAKVIAKAKEDVEAAEIEQSAKDTQTTAHAKKCKETRMEQGPHLYQPSPRRPIQLSAQKFVQSPAPNPEQTLVPRLTIRDHHHQNRHGPTQTSVHRGHMTVDKNQNIPQEVVWRYGGPKNDPEKYHQNFPASLPVRETLYLHGLESLEISLDLNTSANRKVNGHPIVTHVDCKKSQLPAVNNPFDSEYRFKFREEDSKIMNWLEGDKGELLRKAIHNFNQGGNLKAAEGKDYAPRIWLPKIIIGIHKTLSRPRPYPASESEVRSRSASGISRDVPSKPTNSAAKPYGSHTTGSFGSQKYETIVNISN
jgi:hypothetical protein